MPNASVKTQVQTPPLVALRRRLASEVNWQQHVKYILRRFNLVLENVEESSPVAGPQSFLPEAVAKSLAAGSAVAALATQLYGGFGDARGAGNEELNLAKKAADRVATYVLHESLRQAAVKFPVGQVLVMCLGEGSVAKGDEIGGSPMLGFGRAYGSTRAARAAKQQINKVISGESDWEEAQDRLSKAGIKLWGAATDSLENTTRFACGKEGALTVMHVFDGPLRLRRPYEGYMGILSLPAQVGGDWNYGTPRSEILRAIRSSYPTIPPENVHVWTLGGDSRVDRMRELWSEWEKVGVHLVDENWCLPSGMRAFVDSGSYAPMYNVGDFRGSVGDHHLFLVDGYAASAEAVQAATLDSALKVRTSLCLFSTKFKLPCHREGRVMRLDPQTRGFGQTMGQIAEKSVSASLVGSYRGALQHLRDADLPMDRPTFSASELFPGHHFRSVAISSAIRTDPYSGMPGVEVIDLELRRFRVTTRIAAEDGVRNAAFTFRLPSSVQASRPLFCPLLERLCATDSVLLHEPMESHAARIRDELELTYYEAIQASPNGGLSLDLSRIDKRVLPLTRRQSLEFILNGYKRDLPEAFRWLELT